MMNSCGSTFFRAKFKGGLFKGGADEFLRLHFFQSEVQGKKARLKDIDFKLQKATESQELQKATETIVVSAVKNES